MYTSSGLFPLTVLTVFWPGGTTNSMVPEVFSRHLNDSVTQQPHTTKMEFQDHESHKELHHRENTMNRNSLNIRDETFHPSFRIFFRIPKYESSPS